MKTCFNPRTPCGVRQYFSLIAIRDTSFQSTHSLRSATKALIKGAFRRGVSIHALLAECDLSITRKQTPAASFNPRTPCGVRPLSSISGVISPEFQSTHSLRSATRTGEVETIMESVSIHALLAECDVPSGGIIHYTQTFQSTHSLRSATLNGARDWCEYSVSIHALLAECDNKASFRAFPGIRFQSTHSLRSATGFEEFSYICLLFQSTHSLRSATPNEFIIGFSQKFQSTHSLRSATEGRGEKKMLMRVSIHALLAECDCIWMFKLFFETSFNPRTPCGVRLRPTLYIATQQSKSYFAPTSLKRPSLHGCSF